MAEALIRQFATPPKSPRNCIFAQTAETVSADLKTRIAPCQFGGDPDCSSCGCVASGGLAAIAEHRLPVGAIFRASMAIGEADDSGGPAEAGPRRITRVALTLEQGATDRPRQKGAADAGGA